MTEMASPISLSLVDASINDLRQTLDARALTSVQLVALYLHRIGKYDCRGPSLNSIVVLNPNVFEEAQASDDYRASGRPPRPLEGIPFTVKDSFKVKGLTVAAGSPAFANLVASSDAAIVESLRNAGAILLGKTNMPPMADGGPQRGLYGRAESPYNPVYGTTAYASGSSNGSGTSTTASFAAFGFAGETVTSGRSPASNNALVGYSPSRGVIPGRGQWPLYSMCDVIVPHTRSMRDLFDVLNVIVADDSGAVPGLDFWRNQKFVAVPSCSEVRPADHHSLEDEKALWGKRIAVPRCYLGVEGALPTTMCSDSVLDLWNQARADLESLGATVVETDFPLMKHYTKKDFPGQSSNVPGISNEWVSLERCEMIALSWDDFLRENGDERCPDLLAADPDRIHPLVAPMDDPSLHSEAQNQVRYSDMFDAVRARSSDIYGLPGCEQAVHALEDMRKRLYEDWMDSNGFDLMAFPTNGDVPYADADENRESMLHALQEGIKYSNGGRALKHLGIPCISVPMGTTSDKKMPVGLNFCSKAWEDGNLLRWAFAYETGSKRRTTPPLTPALLSDDIDLRKVHPTSSRKATPVLDIDTSSYEREQTADDEIRIVSVSGSVGVTDPTIQLASVNVFVNGDPVEGLTVGDGKWTFEGRLRRPKRVERFPTLTTVPKDQFMVVIIANTSNGRSAAKMLMID
ncbi:amidase signature domain-containing protein [Dactylonectria estremocensis]|uniref:Amidase signature domain-containing protein n=1 Tax=Dactylonectria estremocensis TaxID=1079267 RepID=A0A9P9FAS3_9HYPO|nr:amidase signature domain-containing protein [Dactylonectria estremocensis]